MEIKFALLGCGHIANRHATHIKAHPEAKLTAVYDPKTERAEKLATEYGAKVFNSVEELVSYHDIDIVNVCSPNGLHYAGGKAALEAGKHALIEKPMALNKEHCEELMHLAMQKDKRLYVVKQNRFNPPIAALKKLLEEGRLGNVYSVVVNCYWNRNDAYYNNSDWKGTKELDGGTLFTQFSHFVDIFYYLFGDIDHINGVMRNVSHGDLIDFEDSGFFTFRFKQSGALGSFNYTTSCYEQNMEGSITIFAEKATIKVGGKYLNTLDYQKTEGFDITNLPESGPANDYGYYQGSMSNHDKMIANVVDTLNGRSQIMTNGMEGMKVVEIIENVYNAMEWIQ